MDVLAAVSKELLVYDEHVGIKWVKHTNSSWGISPQPTGREK
jgi:hypothetical protein